MVPTMCAEVSTYAQVRAVREPRRLDERLRGAAPLIRADVDVYRSTPVVSPSGPMTDRIAAHTSRRSDAG
jgi:hypothetical protein